MTHRKAPIEVLESLAEAFVEWANIAEPPGGPARMKCWVEKCQPALSAYRAATAPLRTRAEVDAELCADIREYMHLRYQVDDTQAAQLHAIWERMSELCSEPTRDEPEAAAQDTGWSWRILGGEGYVEWPPVSEHELRFRLDTIHRIASVTRSVTSMEQLRISKLSQP